MSAIKGKVLAGKVLVTTGSGTSSGIIIPDSAKERLGVK